LAEAHPHIQLAERGIEAINSTYRDGDLGPWRTHVERYFHPAVELVTGRGAFTEGEWRGHDGVVRFVANQMEVLESMWLRLDELIEVRDERVVAEISFGGKARYSGLEVELTPVHFWEIDDGLVLR
jgi:hypothetical protein